MRQKLATPAVRAAILAWAVRGCLEWQTSGLGTCAAVDASSAEYRQEMDRFAPFLDERCETGTGKSTLALELRREYEDWCRMNGFRMPLTTKAFAEKLRGKGCESRPTTGGKTAWHGVGLKPKPFDAPELSQ